MIGKLNKIIELLSNDCGCPTSHHEELLKLAIETKKEFKEFMFHHAAECKTFRKNFAEFMSLPDTEFKD